MNSAISHDLTEPHEPHWVSRAAFPVLTAAFLLVEAGLWSAVYHRWYWLAAVVALLASHLMHGLLIGFHEASHGLLRKSRLLNEIDGMLIGVLSFTSFSLYRAAHQTHHAHLGSARDEELWPFVDTRSPRWLRVSAAFLELFAGLFFTPFIFVRTFFRSGSPIRNKKVRRRIWMEFAMIGGFWAAVLGAVSWFHVWEYFLWMYLGPAYLAGNLQSWRKYIEHVGLTGSTVRSATRSIVSQGWLGRMFAFTLLHEPYHGVHHQHAGLTHAELPARVSELAPTHPDEHPPFPSYRQALLHLFRSLADPRVGAQWQARDLPRHQNTEVRA